MADGTTASPSLTEANSSAGNNTAANASLVTSTTTSLYNNLTDVLSTTIPSESTTGGEDSGYHKTLKDETGLVALIVMGIIVPTIFITVVILICRQRRKDLLARRTQMLLQSTQDFALEDYTTLEKATSPPRKL